MSEKKEQISRVIADQYIRPTERRSKGRDKLEDDDDEEEEEEKKSI